MPRISSLLSSLQLNETITQAERQLAIKSVGGDYSFKGPWVLGCVGVRGWEKKGPVCGCLFNLAEGRGSIY